MGQFFFFHASQGHDLNNASGGPIKLWGAGNVTPRFEQRFQISVINNIVGSGQTDYKFNDAGDGLNHPTHGVTIFLVKVQRNGPAPAATLEFKITLRLSGGQVNSLSLFQFFPAQNSSTIFISMASAGWHWVNGEVTVQSSSYSHRCEAKVLGVIVDTVERGFVTTSVTSISSHQTNAASVGHMWIDPTDELIHYIDDLQIEHKIPKTGGSLPAPGVEDGFIYIDSLAPRFGYTVNEKRFLTRTAIREIISKQHSGQASGYIHVTSQTNQRRYWIQMIANDGKNYILTDGRDT